MKIKLKILDARYLGNKRNIFFSQFAKSLLRFMWTFLNTSRARTNATCVASNVVSHALATEKSNSRIKRGTRREEETLDAQKPPRDSEGDVRASEGGLTGAEGDNCRRASLLRCSCKEVLRRDKAPAITIEPRGNSLPTCYTHTRKCVLARSRDAYVRHTRCGI